MLYLRPLISRAPALAAAPNSLASFKNDLQSILQSTEGTEPFRTIKQRFSAVMANASRNETIRSACPDYFFEAPASVHSLRDIRSLINALLRHLEGEDMPPSQIDAWPQLMAELSPEAAKIISTDAQRVSDAPGPLKKK